MCFSNAGDYPNNDFSNVLNYVDQLGNHGIPLDPTPGNYADYSKVDKHFILGHSLSSFFILIRRFS